MSALSPVVKILGRLLGNLLTPRAVHFVAAAFNADIYEITSFSDAGVKAKPLGRYVPALPSLR